MVIVVIGTALSLLAFEIAREGDDARVRSALELQAEWRAGDFEHKIALAAEDVESIAAYSSVQLDLDIARFHDFAHFLHRADDAISAVIWAPLVKGTERDAFVAEARRNGLAEFDIIERGSDGPFKAAAQREAYLPTLVEDNYDSTPPPAGFDIMSLPERWSRAERARDEGRPIATPAVNVYSTTGSRLGFLVFWPVYTTIDVPTTRDARRSAFRGMAIGRFHFDRLLPALIAGTPRFAGSLDILVDRGRDGTMPLPVAHFDPSVEVFTIGSIADGTVEGGVSLSREFDVLGRHWTLRSHFPPASVAALRSGAPWMWLLFGLLLTGTVSSVVQREHARRLTIEAVVKERTGELSTANRSLEAEVQERRAAEARLLQSEGQLKLFIEVAPASIAMFDRDMRYLATSRRYLDDYGLGGSLVVGRSHYDIFPEIPERWREIHRRCLAGAIERCEEEQFPRIDGSLDWVKWEIRPWHTGGGEIGGIVLFSEVTTQRKRAQLALAEREQQLVQAQKMEAIGNLTGGMAHDFNNLLGVIIGNLDMARPRVAADAETRELVDESFDAAWRGADLTRRLLAFARRQPLQPRPIELNELVTGMVKLLSRVLGENIEISLDLAKDLWPVVADPAQLEASIANLATNARDAMPKGGRLMIATANRQLDADYAASHAEVAVGDYAVIEVSDTGTGMPAAVISRIFEPFFTTKEVGKGTGLGLSMVFGFMKQSVGHVSVYSEPGAGTTFRLYLPRAVDAAIEATVAAPRAPRQGAGGTVLAVEDNPALRRVVVRQLKALGYHTIEADSAASALTALETEKIDLVFTDVVMPGELDGLGLARRILATRPHLKVVLTSGFTENKVDGNLGAMAASVRLLSKPYTREELARLLRDVLDGV